METSKGDLWPFSNGAARLAVALFENNGELGYRRLQSDPNVYIHVRRLYFILVYVDDMLMLAPKEIVDQIFEELAKHFLIRKTGHINEEGSQTDFLGRNLGREGDGIAFRGNSQYLDEDIIDWGLLKAKTVSTTGTIFTGDDGDEEISVDAHRQYRRTVGKLQWLVPIRPDLVFPVKELARGLTGLTKYHVFMRKHLIK